MLDAVGVLGLSALSMSSGPHCCYTLRYGRSGLAKFSKLSEHLGVRWVVLGLERHHVQTAVGYAVGVQGMLFRGGARHAMPRRHAGGGARLRCVPRSVVLVS